MLFSTFIRQEKSINGMNQKHVTKHQQELKNCLLTDHSFNVLVVILVLKTMALIVYCARIIITMRMDVEVCRLCDLPVVQNNKQNHNFSNFLVIINPFSGIVSNLQQKTIHIFLKLLNMLSFFFQIFRKDLSC